MSEHKEYLRGLAKKQLEYANTPENQRLKEEWYAHNRLEGKRPMIVFEEETLKNDILTLKCEDKDERFLESQLLQNIAVREMIGDDKVTPDFIKIDLKLFGVENQRTVAKEGLGYHDEPVLIDLKADLAHRHFTTTKKKLSGLRIWPKKY